ncbi:MAG: protein kinase [Nannocystaceae bacterium]
MTSSGSTRPFPVPEREHERLAALRRHAILDTPAEGDFDALVHAAAELCGAPIALVSLIDEDRQWFKAKLGLEASSTPRDQAFCAHAIVGDELFEVEDALADPRFADNPLVTGAPDIRFYAGAPLRTADGHALGTLCVIDRAPRSLRDDQREGLRALADEVVRELALRREFRELGREGARPSAAQETAPGFAAAARVGGGGDAGAKTARIAAAETAVSVLLRATDLPPSPSFGRYTIRFRLGAGAMATVYAAHDAELDRLVALKLIHDDPSEDGYERVAREARALARVSHPNVVQIFEVGRYGGQAFVAMELVEGETLGAWQRERARTVDELLDMYIQAGHGLVAAHEAGIIHRDFKAENVLIGGDERPRVADFGLARALGVDDERRQASAAVEGDARDLTGPGAVIGTPAYMSPEQHRGALVDERSDQFNFCAALHEAIYGVRPFDGATIAEIRAQAMAGVLSEPPPGVPRYPSIDAVLARGLAHEPDDRWPSLAELLEHLAVAAPRVDPAASSRIRRRFMVGLGVIAVGVAVALQGESRVDPGGLLPSHLVIAALVIFIALGLAAALVRRSLLRSAFHRPIVGGFLMITGASFYARLVAALAGEAMAGVILADLAGVGLTAFALGRSRSPIFYTIAAPYLIAGLVVAAGAPPVLTSSLALAVAIPLAVVAWDRAPSWAPTPAHGVASSASGRRGGSSSRRLGGARVSTRRAAPTGRAAAVGE